MSESYYELLRRPEWQEKRLRIMDRDGFACRECGDKGTTLNVHHGYYLKDHKPWEYPDESLRTLCEPCHKKRSELDKWTRKALASLDASLLQRVGGYVVGVALLHYESGSASLSRDGIGGLADALAVNAARLAECFAPGVQFTFADLVRFCASQAATDVTPPATPDRPAIESGRSLCGDCRA